MTNYVECGMCHKKLMQGTPELAQWQMQHLYYEEFEDGKVQLLTCDKCKFLSPMEFLEAVEKLEPTAPEIQ